MLSWKVPARVGCDNQWILKVAKILIEVYIRCNLIIPPSQYLVWNVKQSQLLHLVLF